MVVQPECRFPARRTQMIRTRLMHRKMRTTSMLGVCFAKVENCAGGRTNVRGVQAINPASPGRGPITYGLWDVSERVYQGRLKKVPSLIP